MRVGRNPGNPRRGETGQQNDTKHLPREQHHGISLLLAAQQIRRIGYQGCLENEAA